MATKKTSADYTDFARQAFEPATRLNALVAGNVERIAKFQYAWAGDLLQFGLDQMQAAVAAKDLPSLISQQREIATRLVEKAQVHQATLTDIASDAQAGFLQWAEGATSFKPRSKAA